MWCENHSLRLSLAALAVLAVCTPAPLSAQAQSSFPSQPIKFIVPAAAGGLPDTVARIVGRRLQERLNQPVVIENRPGANGSVAATALVNSAPDGYNFIVFDGGILSINPLLYAKLSYDPKNIVPVALLARAPQFLAVHPKVPAKTMNEFIAYVRANPGNLNYGSSGVGSTHHLTMEVIKSSLKLDMGHVPYKGTGESVPALLGGHIQAVLSSYPSLKGFVEDRRVILLATNSADRSPQALDVPAVAEFIPGFDFAPMIGIFARDGTAPAIVQKLAAEVALIAREPDIVKQFGTVGVEPVGAGPDGFDRALRSEIARVALAVRAAGIKAE